MFTKYLVCKICHLTLVMQSYCQVTSVSYVKVGSCFEIVSVSHLKHWRNFRMCYVYSLQNTVHVHKPLLYCPSQSIGTNSVVQHFILQVCATFRPNSIDLTHKRDPVKVPQVLTYKTPVVTICTAKFNIQQFSVLPTQCIYVFCVDLRTNSDYFPIQH